MIFAPTNRRIIRPGDKPSFEHTQRYGLIKGHWANAGRIGWWMMNEGAGKQALDVSGNGNTGTINGATVWSVGNKGAELYNTGGSDGYVDVGYPIIGTKLKGLSVECVLRTDNIAGARMIAENGTAFNTNTFYLYRNGANIQFEVYGAAHDDRISTLSMSTNVWYHTICTWTSGAAPNVYINGVLSNGATAGNIQTSLIDGNTTLQIGHRPGPSLVFEGSISLFRVYNRALTASEIAELYWNPFVGIERIAAPVYFFVPVAVGDVTVEPATLELALAQETPIVSIDCTVTPATFELALTQEVPTVVLPEADWIGISSAHIDSVCGEKVGKTLAEALNGTDMWSHETSELPHWFILDLGQTYNVQRVRGRSMDSVRDPVDVNIYVSDDKGSWGAAVASGIATWKNTSVWQEVDTTDKDGRYVKVEIVETEHASGELSFGYWEVPFTIFDVYGEVPPPPPTIVEPATLEVAATLHAPSVFPIVTVTPESLALAVALLSPVVAIDVTVTPTTFELTAALLAPEILAGVIVTPDTFELALTQHAPGVRIDCTVLAETLELALTLHAPSVFPIVTVSPESLALAIALLSPIVVIDVTVTPDTFALALTQYAPVVSFEVIVFPAVLELEATLHAPETISRYTTIPPFMQKDLIDPYSGGAWLWLCEIAVPGQAKVRIARNTENVSYDSEDYEKFNFQIGEQVFSGDGSIPRVTLQIFQDVNRVIEDMVNETEGALGAGVKLIRVNEKFLDTPVAALEADYENLASESDSEWVTFTLGVPNPLTQRFPLRIDRSDACPWATPSLFKGPECQYTGGDSFCTGTFNDCYLKGNAEHWGAELGLDPNVVRV